MPISADRKVLSGQQFRSAKIVFLRGCAFSSGVQKYNFCTPP